MTLNLPTLRVLVSLLENYYIYILERMNFFNDPDVFFWRSQPSISNPNSGQTPAGSTLQEGRLGWTQQKPSYRPTGTHPSPRSASV